MKVSAAILASVAASMTCSEAEAFIAPSASSSFTGTGRVVAYRAASPVHLSTTQMNLADRFMRVAKANLNSLLQKVEDPEKVLEQAVDDMQRDLVKVRQSYAEVSATQKRMERQRAEANRIAEEWYKRAQLALEKGDEGLAREALARRQTQVDIVATVGAQMDTQQQALDQLRSGMQALEAKITEAKGKKDALIARARSAKTTQNVNDMLNNVTGSSGMEAFERMQQKVEALESTAEVSAQLSGTAGGSLEQQFAALEGSTAVDKELAALRASLPGSSSSPSRALPEAGKLDDELAQLKRELGQ
ncbi:PspA/IM30 family-domain-containing protein [Tribonema minus]|uniref:PspA/IM30 family-domain-containing protein n=1 Tax=Tribonema minus TaxID=303371 RepID=A0A836CIH9_9STRA|nr:PspA/IM30 family-domain-containing protein [Tribonema minus]